MSGRVFVALSVFGFALAGTAPAEEPASVPLEYNNPGLVVDLGVGLWAWPLPMDYDEDGDLDLVIASGGKPYEGLYFFENPGGGPMSVFKPGRRIGDNARNAVISPGGEVMTPGNWHLHFRELGFARHVGMGVDTEHFHQTEGRIRANQWKQVDYDGDGALDLIVGIGDWADYGWDDAYNESGEWTNGPLHGYVYWARNEGTNGAPRYAEAQKVRASGKPVDVIGMPSPSFADFDGDGDLDLICGEFLDGFTYFENVGARREPEYAAGRRLTHDGKPLAMHVQMITPTSVDWDGDGDPDLIVGDEDGRVAFVENTGDAQFLPPRYFQQEADDLKFGALVTPVGHDFDGDGDEDIVAGNTSGQIAWFENLDGGNPPRWAAPRLIEAAGQPIHLQAGPNGSIQGPAEAKWGYTTLSIADWDLDGVDDLIVNGITGRVVYYPGLGRHDAPRFGQARSIRAEAPRKPAWEWRDPQPNEFVTQWRTTPLVADWNEDGLPDLIMLDHEGYLALFERTRRDGRLTTLPGRRMFQTGGPSVFDRAGQITGQGSGPLRLNDGEAGRSGRRKLTLADWNGDGRHDLLVNSTSADLFLNLRTDDGNTIFEWKGPLTDAALSGHTTSPTTVDWDGDGDRDLLVGAEDGRLYYFPNTR